MRPDFATCTLEELWLHISSHLTKKGIPSVLVGGAVVTIYTKGAYVSGDLDFVPPLLSDSKQIAAAMTELGFEKGAHRSYSHPQCRRFFIDFVSPPLSIGHEIGIKPFQRTEGDVQVLILSPTDCVKDRLAGYVYFQALECLNQAVLVAQSHIIDQADIEHWCRQEGATWAYLDFCEALAKI